MNCVCSVGEKSFYNIFFKIFTISTQYTYKQELPMLNALVPGVHWKVTYLNKPASESIKGLDLWEKPQINPRNVSNPRGAKNDFNHSKIDFTVQESVFTYWNLLERFLSAKWVIWSCAQITLMNTSERIHSTVKFILLTKTTILVLTEWRVSSRSCCSHLTIALDHVSS